MKIVNTMGKKIQVQPYEGLAPIYDQVMDHVDYQRWANYVESIWTGLEMRVSGILELACGTGKLAEKLQEKGYKVDGLDLSWAMVREARGRGLKGHFWQGDMVNFKVKKSYDCFLCLYDSVNYLLQPRELMGMFHNVGDNALQGALFIFDICTERNSLKNFNNYFEKRRLEKVSYQRRVGYHPRSKIHWNTFIIRVSEPVKAVYEEHHRQRIYSREEVESALKPGGWTLQGVYDGFTLNEAHEGSMRVHFVSEKGI